MTKYQKNQILYKLNFLKSIGYNYFDSLNISKVTTTSHNLPDSLDELKTIVEHCSLCELCKSRKNVLFGVGSISSDIVFILDEPSSFEDEIGSYYVGKTGELLQKMIESVLNISVNEVYLTNIVKCKTSNNVIKNQEADNCLSYLYKQIDLIKPKLIVLLGDQSYKYFMNDGDESEDIRGNFFKYNDIDVITTYHPNFLLRNPSLKKEAFHDILKIKTIMEKF